MAVLLGVIEVTHQLTKTEEQTTYSITLESLALGNGETDGENGGTTGGGGSTDGESDMGEPEAVQLKEKTMEVQLVALPEVL